MLLETLLHHRDPADKLQADPVEKLEVIAAVVGGQISMIFRKNISGITQRLGEILLKEDDQQEIDTISWAATAVLRSSSLEQEVQDLTVKYDQQSQTIKKLNQQLEDFIEAKREHETALLEKFRDLLNAKKLKIRDQQRLLAGAKVDPKQAAKLQSARQTPKARTPAPSRKGKRKASTTASAPSSDGEDAGFEQIKSNKRRESDASEQANTPEPFDTDVTEDESDNEVEAAARPISKAERPKAGDERGEEMQVDTPPPTRELPFGKNDAGGDKGLPKSAGTQQSWTVNRVAGNEDEETDDDDEL